MSWVNKYKLPAIEAIKYNNQLCLTLDSLWNTLDFTFNTILNCHINIRVLDKVKNKPKLLWNPFSKVLWQLLITKINNHTSSKSLKLNIKWKVHKRTWQGVSAKLEFYIYKVHIVYATTSYLPHFLLKATILYTCALISSSRFFHHVLGLWHHIMWPVMWQ